MQKMNNGYFNLEKVLERYELLERSPVIRMAGCPSGCARPYAAEIGIVGQMRGKYAIFIGGRWHKTRLV